MSTNNIILTDPISCTFCLFYRFIFHLTELWSTLWHKVTRSCGFKARLNVQQEHLHVCLFCPKSIVADVLGYSHNYTVGMNPTLTCPLSKCNCLSHWHGTQEIRLVDFFFLTPMAAVFNVFHLWVTFLTNISLRLLGSDSCFTTMTADVFPLWHCANTNLNTPHQKSDKRYVDMNCLLINSPSFICIFTLFDFLCLWNTFSRKQIGIFKEKANQRLNSSSPKSDLLKCYMSLFCLLKLNIQASSLLSCVKVTILIYLFWCCLGTHLLLHGVKKYIFIFDMMQCTHKDMTKVASARFSDQSGDKWKLSALYDSCSFGLRSSVRP